MKLRLIPVVALVAAALCACPARRIPGTDIVDNDDSRAILDVVEQYRSALENRDAGKLLGLVSEEFKDTAGSPNPADDLDYNTLKQRLPERLSKLEDVKVDLSVRRIAVERDVASVIYYYNTRYRVPKLTGKPISEGDLQQMWLKKADGKWRILSGI
ncbi:MAG TPA: nuclear transport factor 2 family protein [Myxococcaceae bacterium]|nr:nuclear transport factor 2 family protein [Myxococcaceae bacterium]